MVRKCNGSNKIIYLDNNGTTKICMPAKKNMIKWLDCMSNPSSNSKVSSNAGVMINNVKKYIITHCSSPKYRVIFTSGASESNCLIIKSCVESYNRLKKRKPHIITSSVEHKSIIKCCSDLVNAGMLDITYINPLSDGRILPSLVSKAILPNTCLVTIMSANNEIGCVNDINAIGKITHSKKIPYHCDMTQTFGKYKVNLRNNNVDAVSASFHKLYGPMGIGVLIICDDLIKGYELTAQISGTQNDGLRGGTENVPAIAGAYCAMVDTFKDRGGKNKHLLKMRNKLITGLQSHYTMVNYTHGFDVSKIPDFCFTVLGPTKVCEYIPNTLLCSFISKKFKFCNVLLKDDLNKNNIVVSIGSACNTSSTHASHVMSAIRIPDIIKRGVIRISLGDNNTISEMNNIIVVIVKCIDKQIRSNK